MGVDSSGTTCSRRSVLRAGAAGLAAGTLGLPDVLFAQTSREIDLRPMVGRVSDRSAVVSLAGAAGKVPAGTTVTWGLSPDRLTNRGGTAKAVETMGQVAAWEAELTGLPADAEVFYRVGAAGPTRRFRTARRAGSGFTFTLQGDSHPERPSMFDAGLYRRTLDAVSTERADFHVCMGDDFSISHLRQYTPATVAQRYEQQRQWLSAVGATAPVLLVNGNHEQASLANYNAGGVARDASVWAQRARNSLFPLPGPDGFYRGNETPMEGIGRLRDFAAFTWGDATLILLDNYWHSPVTVDTPFGDDKDAKGGKNRDPSDWWKITLGDAQYHFLADTLAKCTSRYVFVFAHHVLGWGRGGVECAGSFEWGGKNRRGIDEFKRYRPDWELPVHQLMAKHRVSAFFQGHDHLYCRQELDGVVYQEVPLPADPFYNTHNNDRYQSGVKLPNSGFLRVSVSPAETTVEYVRSLRPNDEGKGLKQGDVSHRYTIKPRR